MLGTLPWSHLHWAAITLPGVSPSHGISKEDQVDSSPGIHCGSSETEFCSEYPSTDFPPPLVVLLQACASDEQKKEVTQSWGVPALPWGLCWVYWDLKARTGFTWGAQGTSQRRSLGHRSLNEKQTRRCPQLSRVPGPVCAMDLLLTALLIRLQCACLWEVSYLFQLWDSS